MVDPVLPLIAIGAAGLTPSAAILALRDRDAKRWSGELVPYRLEVSSSFDPAGLQQFLSALTGLLPSKWERPVSIRGIGVEAIATPAGIAHYLLVPQSQTDIVLGQLRASVPGARVTKELDYRPAAPTLAGELATAQPSYQLQVEYPEMVATGILASLQPLDGNEQMIVQWLLLPVARSNSNRLSPVTSFVNGISTAVTGKAAPVPATPPREILDKQRLTQFVATIRLGVTSASQAWIASFSAA